MSTADLESFLLNKNYDYSKWEKKSSGCGIDSVDEDLLIEYVNGGHNPSLIYAKDRGEFRYLDVEANFVLGGRKNIAYESQSIILKPGDSLFLYTDGVTEAMNAAEELYGEDRLLAALNKSAYKDDPTALLREIARSVTDFVGEAEQSDDITMLGLNYWGPV